MTQYVYFNKNLENTVILTHTAYTIHPQLMGMSILLQVILNSRIYSKTDSGRLRCLLIWYLQF